MARRYLLLGLLVVLLLAGCTVFSRGGNSNQYLDPTQAKYYQGTDGVEMQFDQLPPRLYYYGNVPDSSVNEFPFSIQVWNEGASYSRGAVFVSGYDPHLVEIDKIPIGKSYPGACSLRIGDYSLNRLGMTMQCGDNFQWSGGEGNWLQSITVKGKTWFDNSILSSLIVNFDHQSSGSSLDIVFDDTKLSFDKREHGILLIALLAGISFEKYLGQEFLLAGDTYDYPGGEQDYVPYTGRIVNWPEGVDTIKQHFMATSCYMYTTFAAPLVCIDPQPYAETRKVCSPAMASWSGGQGAPLAVTSVTQESTPRTAVFHITVRNVGGGTVFDPGQLEKCSPYFPGGAKASDKDAFWIGEVRIGTTSIRDRCTPDGRVRLNNGQAEFTCSYPIEYAELNSAYTAPLVVELWYGYSKTIDRIVPVKRVS